MTELSDFDRGLVIGLLVGEASFGGDGKQPQVTLRMHVRHETLFGWLIQRFPETLLWARTTTAAAPTTSGWRAGPRSSGMSFPCSNGADARARRRTPPSG